MENFSWGTLLYFISTKWKRLTGELNDISCPPSGKLFPENSTEFMSTKWKLLAGELAFYYISCPQSQKSELENYYISCPQSGKVRLERSKILYVHEVEKFIWRTVRYFNIHQLKNRNWKVLPYFISTKWKR